MSNVVAFPAAPSQVVVAVTGHDGSALLSYPVVPDGPGAIVLMPGFVCGASDRNRLRCYLREALAFLGSDEPIG